MLHYRLLCLWPHQPTVALSHVVPAVRSVRSAFSLMRHPYDNLFSGQVFSTTPNLRRIDYFLRQASIVSDASILVHVKKGETWELGILFWCLREEAEVLF
ncbi:hypothetical protein Droror1_Dr00006852 [Drosera rotundifolia]